MSKMGINILFQSFSSCSYRCCDTDNCNSAAGFPNTDGRNTAVELSYSPWMTFEFYLLTLLLSKVVIN